MGKYWKVMEQVVGKCGKVLKSDGESVGKCGKVAGKRGKLLESGEKVWERIRKW